MAELCSYPAHRKSGVVNLHLRLRAPVPYPTEPVDTVDMWITRESGMG